MVVYDPQPEAVQAVAQQGAAGASTLAELVDKLAPPRAVWVMVPAGEPTESTVNALGALLSTGDAVIDGGNAFYKDSVRRAAALKERGIHFLDAGTSGGVWGLAEGYSLMVGGDLDTFRRLEPIFQTLAPGPDQGYGHVGPAGAGHFVKMVHNGVEYGLMQAYAEGFEALRQDPGLEKLQAYVEDSGEGRWTVQESIDLGVPAPVIALSLQARFRSRQDQPFGGKLLAAMREQFGGHATRKADDG